jgi:hypothetical protein
MRFAAPARPCKRSSACWRDPGASKTRRKRPRPAWSASCMMAPVRSSSFQARRAVGVAGHYCLTPACLLIRPAGDATTRRWRALPRCPTPARGVRSSSTSHNPRPANCRSARRRPVPATCRRAPLSPPPGATPFTADRATIQFVKERGIPDRRLYAVTFDDQQHDSWFWLIAAERDHTGRWVPFDVAGGSGQIPQRLGRRPLLRRRRGPHRRR